MRVLYFTRDYTTHDHRFLSALSETGHQVYYLRLERRGHSLEDRPVPAQIEQVSWAGGQAPARWQDGPRLLAGLKEVIASVQPDLVHAGPLQTGALLAAMSGFRPLVSMSWGSDLLVDSTKNTWYRWATHYALRSSDVLVGDCEPVRQKAIEFGMPPERIVTFPWGVDLDHFTPTNEPGGEAGQPFTLLSTRSWESLYGVEVIARAFVLAAGQCPDLRLVMLGGGSQADLLRGIFSQAGLEERVFFPGQVGQSRLPQLYNQADLYVSASHSDGTSISLLEALACGRPVLLSDIPGNRQWIEPGVQGWYFPDGDEAALSQAILQAVSMRRRFPEMGRAARLLAEERADWKQNFPHLLRAYDLARQVQQSA